MNSRERVLKTIARQEPDRVPTYLWLTPYLIERLKKERGVSDYEDYLKKNGQYSKMVREWIQRKRRIFDND